MEVSSNQQDIEKLECHFKWKPLEDDNDAQVQKSIDQLTLGIKEHPDLKVMFTTLIGFLHSKRTPSQNERVVAICDDVVEFCKEIPENKYDDYKGYETIALNNKINALLLLNKQEEVAHLLRTLTDYQTLTAKSRASIFASHAFALSYFDVNKFGKGIEMYQKAIELDPDDYLWRIGLAFVAGKNRRLIEGLQTLPTLMEEFQLQRAVELSNEIKTFPLILLADVYFLKSRDFESGGNIVNQQLMEKARDLYMKAYTLNPHASHVLKRCGKAFHIMGDEELGLECLLEAVFVDPENSQNLHRLGQLYEFGTRTRDYFLAEEFYQNALTCGRSRNFYAELNLGKLRQKQNKNYDVRKYYEEMKQHYSNDEIRLNYLDAKIKSVEEYSKKKLVNYRGEEDGRSKGGEKNGIFERQFRENSKPARKESPRGRGRGREERGKMMRGRYRGYGERSRGGRSGCDEREGSAEDNEQNNDDQERRGRGRGRGPNDRGNREGRGGRGPRGQRGGRYTSARINGVD